jgi:DNA-binding IclR family transcriptional regulator
MARALPEVVIDFIYRYVESSDVLEVLLRLCDEPTRSWTAEQIAAKCGLSTAQASDVLAGLLYKGFVAFSDGAYRFQPRDPELLSGVTACARAYRDGPTAVVREIASLGSARSFAEAFRLRRPKGKKDG